MFPASVSPKLTCLTDGHLSLPVSREEDIDFPKHLVPPDPWPYDLQVRRKSGRGIEV